MLSRVADSLYWMSRYLERAEHTARLLDVQLTLMLDQVDSSPDRCWQRVAESLGISPDAGQGDPRRLLQGLMFDLAHHSSVVACIVAARENARQVREQVSSEMWEQLNRLFHEVKKVDARESWDQQPLDFLYAVREGTALFQGLADSTMSHGEGWHFIQVGRALERARATARLVDVQSREFLAGTRWGSDGDHPEWIGLLKSCAAYEAYCKVYTANVRPDRVAEFLLLNPEFPHSVRFSVDALRLSLVAIQESVSTRKSERVERLAGRLQATLSFSHIDEVLAAGLDPYLDSVQRQCGQIHDALHEVYITYPIEVALEA